MQSLHMDNKRRVQIQLEFEPLSSISSTVLVDGRPTAQALFSRAEFPKPWLSAILGIAQTTYASSSGAGDNAYCSEYEQGQAATMLPTPWIQTIPDSIKLYENIGGGMTPPVHQSTLQGVSEDGGISDSSIAMVQRPDQAARRMKKLRSTMQRLYGYVPRSMQEHGDIVRQLMSQDEEQPPCRNEAQLAGRLSQLGSRWGEIGTVHALLSWNIFRRVEEEMIRKKHMSPPMASKEVRHA